MASDIGIMGIGVMGANLARNFARHGYAVSVYGRHQDQMDAFITDYKHEGAFVGTTDLQEFVDSLSTPRRVMMMVPAGDATDAAIAQIEGGILHGMNAAGGGRPQPYEVRLRIAARSPDRKTAAAVGFEVRTLHVNGPSGGGGGTNSIKEVLAVKSILIPRSMVKTHISVEGAK